MAPDYTKQIQIIITPDTGPEELILVDGSIRESHTDAALFTQRPVGKGAVISDHKIDSPSFFTADLIVTEYPNEMPKTNVPAEARTEATRVQYAGVVGDTSGPSEDLQRGARVYQRLLELQVAGTFCRIISSKRSYRNMVLTGLDVPVENSSTSTLITAQFQQIFLAQSQQATIEVVPKVVLKKTQSKGRQEATPVENPPPPRSILTAIGKFFSG